MLGSTPFRYLDNEFTAIVHFHHLNRPLLTFPFFNERYNWKVMIVIFCNQIRHENGFEFVIAENSLIAKLFAWIILAPKFPHAASVDFHEGQMS